MFWYEILNYCRSQSRAHWRVNNTTLSHLDSMNWIDGITDRLQQPQLFGKISDLQLIPMRYAIEYLCSVAVIKQTSTRYRCSICKNCTENSIFFVTFVCISKYSYLGYYIHTHCTYILPLKYRRSRSHIGELPVIQHTTGDLYVKITLKTQYFLLFLSA